MKKVETQINADAPQMNTNAAERRVATRHLP